MKYEFVSKSRLWSAVLPFVEIKLVSLTKTKQRRSEIVTFPFVNMELG